MEAGAGEVQGPPSPHEVISILQDGLREKSVQANLFRSLVCVLLRGQGGRAVISPQVLEEAQNLLGLRLTVGKKGLTEKERLSLLGRPNVELDQALCLQLLLPEAPQKNLLLVKG